MASEIHHLKVHVLTPLHIGAAQEKHLREGLDFLQEDGVVWIFDQSRIIEKFGLEAYCNALERGRAGIGDLMRGRRAELAEISSVQLPLTGHAEDYHAMIKDGAAGKPLLPGSSVKGALSSVLLKRLIMEAGDTPEKVMADRNDRSKIKQPEQTYLGTFDNSLMRFIQCADTAFDGFALYNTKIFNLMGRGNALSGGWKHALQNRTTADFNPTDFTTAYECIPPGAWGAFRLGFDRIMYDRYSGKSMLKRGAARIFAGRFVDVLMEEIYRHTAEYLHKEIAFFRKYSCRESDAVLAALEDIQARNTPDTPVLRMAHGSGFHSITGDWQYDDYCNDRDVDDRSGKKKYKSRRLAFDLGPGGEYRFHPMGFIQLMTRDYYDTRFRAEAEAEQARREAERRAAAAEKQAKAAEELRLAEEARKPVMVSAGQLNFKKQPVIDGVVVGQNGAYLLCRPFIEEYKEVELSLRYPAGMPEGTVVRFRVTLQGKKLQPIGAPTIKTGKE
ncbi:MAG TPA: RAMP superfamily CRISPR-associated protein [Flavilitoribacter sp.]|nr:RAMP superfamily CRISPR-associated protein [Flavilitoribacter sp.]HMQ89040.1 RAMP superfamily CRISPR-associated protein [Flavilitoribacter sp.]